MPTNCKVCQSTELIKRGNGFKNLCRACYNAIQREAYKTKSTHEKRAARYAKHSVKRRAEAAEYKLANRTKYTLLEWFRKKGIPANQIESIDDLVAMGDAVKAAKLAVENSKKKNQ